MDIFEFAMQMELDGKAFYEKGAAKTSNPELKKIFLTLAEEEQRHYNIFKNLKNGQLEAATQITAGRAKTISITKNLFQKMTEEGKNTLFGDDISALWEEAVAIEEKSEKLYREEAHKTKDPDRQKLLNKIADEEKNHIYLIDNMLSFINDPQSFVASNQFSSFMSWEGH